MKIRTGFVSNSSSSSFIVVGKTISYNEATKRAKSLISKGRLYAHGTWECEGADFFRVTAEMWDLIGESMRYIPFTFYDVQIFSEEYAKVRKDKLDGDDLEVFVINVDQHSTNDTETLKERYGDQ